MLHVFISRLGVPRGVKRVLAFSQMLRLDPGSSIKLLQYKAKHHVVQFDTETLFSFDFPLKYLKSLLATHYVAFSILLVWLWSEKL